MTILELKNTLKINPVKLTAEELREKVLFDFGNQESKAETGSVILEVDLKEGEININDQVSFLSDNMHKGIITIVEKQENGSYIIENNMELIVQ